MYHLPVIQVQSIEINHKTNTAQSEMYLAHSNPAFDSLHHLFHEQTAESDSLADSVWGISKNAYVYMYEYLMICLKRNI